MVMNEVMSEQHIQWTGSMARRFFFFWSYIFAPDVLAETGEAAGEAVHDSI